MAYQIRKGIWVKALSNSTETLPNISAILKAGPKIFPFLLVLIVATFFAYFNSFHASFHFDDSAYITDNPRMHLPDLSLDSLWPLIRHPDTSRPLASLGFAINYHLSERNVLSYHIINYLIHLANSFLVFYLSFITLSLGLKKTASNEKTHRKNKHLPLSLIDQETGSYSLLFNSLAMDPKAIASFLAAFWWALLPVHTEAVTYIWQRITCASTLGYLLGLVGYIQAVRSGKKAWVFTAIGGSILAFGHKEISATLPIFMILYDLVFLCRFEASAIKRSLTRFGFLVGAALFIVFLFALSMKNLHPAQPELVYAQPPNYCQRLMTQGRILVYYLSLLAFPHPSRLMLDYAYPISYSVLNPPTTALSFIFIASLIASAAMYLKRYFFTAFSILWFFGNCAIEAISPTTDLAFEYRLYLPSIGIALLIAHLTLKLIHKQTKKTAILLCGFFVWSVLLGIWSYQRNAVWKSDIDLWSDNAKKAPHNPRAHMNLALTLAHSGKVEEALPEYEKAVRLAPNYALIRRNYGIALFSLGFVDQAIEQYLSAKELSPEESETYYDLGYAYFAKGNMEESIATYLSGLECPDPAPKIYLSLGNVYLRIGELKLAVEAYSKGAAQLPQDARLYMRLGDSYYLLENFSKAHENYQKARELNPSSSIYEKKADAVLNYISQRQKKSKIKPPSIVEIPRYWGPD